jgi:hypothetical protein
MLCPGCDFWFSLNPIQGIGGLRKTLQRQVYQRHAKGAWDASINAAFLIDLTETGLTNAAKFTEFMIHHVELSRRESSEYRAVIFVSEEDVSKDILHLTAVFIIRTRDIMTLIHRLRDKPMR